MKKITVISLAIVLALTGLAFAQDSVTFSVSCTIPAVPGINAPPFPQDSANQNIQQEIAEEEQSQGKTGTIQEEVEEEIQLADGKTAVVNVQTIYSR